MKSFDFSSLEKMWAMVTTIFSKQDIFNYSYIVRIKNKVLCVKTISQSGVDSISL